MVLLYWVLFCFTWFFFLNNIILYCLTRLITKRYIVKQGTVDYFCLPGRLRCFVLHEFKQVKLCWNVPFVLHLNRTLQFIIRVDFRTVRVDQSLIFCIGFCKLLLSIFFFFFELLIAPFAASDCPCGGFWLPLWWLLIAPVVASDCPFGIFKLFLRCCIFIFIICTISVIKTK